MLSETIMADVSSGAQSPTDTDLLSDVRSNSSGSSKASQRSKTSVSSSTKSARAKEMVKVAELLAERAMLEKKQALRAQNEALKLEIEIPKAQARERAYAGIEGATDRRESREDTHLPAIQSHPKHSSPLQEAPTTPLNPLSPDFYPKWSDYCKSTSGQSLDSWQTAGK